MNGYRTRRSSSLLLAAFALVASGAVSADDSLVARQQAARKVTMKLVKELGGALKAELKRGGPAAAIRVCRDRAPAIAGRFSLQTGWRVTRVGTRVRNPMLGMPDAWERQVLNDFERRAAQGGDLARMAHGEVVEESGVRYFRFMKAMPVKPVCLMCHGAPKDLAPEVKAALDSQYPQDRAIGYRLGELRGAVSIKQPLDIPLPEEFAGR
ncbi:DUF3365 domain-containing protein [Thiohalobacter sp. IOR34]|uniref:Tll0287-like domain-containing protein n=1 Tax=Thiohalobacter sp. IOR34 TaxID=3057176 RepID=UPI0025AFB24B|nr:DUF3365 domain-containing protein [Thiohalobacter sp. IOR34]WJW76384.1 DUF3365 domain-containing protein [Thiohalobacter sp. IOR34]